MEKKIGKCLVGVVILFTVTIGTKCADVTTVYKFNSLKSQQNVQYLNTCAVVLHIEDNYLSLPLLNISNNEHLSFSNPTLSNASLWQMEMLNESSSLITVMDQLFDSSNPIKIENNVNVYHRALEGENSNGYDLSSPNKMLKVTTYSDYNVENIFDCQDFRTIFEFESGDRITVNFQTDQIEVHKDNYIHYITKYSLNENISNLTVYISMKNGYYTFVLSSYKFINTGVNIPTGYGTLVNIRHEYTTYCNSYNLPIYYDIVTLKTPSVLTLISPWFRIKRKSSIFILFNNYNIENDSSMNISLEEESTRNSIQLEHKDEDKSNLDIASEEGILKKVVIENSQNWTGKYRIRIKSENSIILISKIWEGRDETQIKIASKQFCQKSNLNIYNILQENNTGNVVDPLFCTNGGKLVNGRCVCPPGFTGIQCENACNKNRFGQGCSIPCTKLASGCKGMILCTKEFGCSCAPGYQGEKCLEQCSEGTYGADCSQSCSIGCQSGCDIYTGNCLGKCILPSLMGIKCDQYYSYVKQAPVYLSSNFTSVELGIDLSADNIINTYWFMTRHFYYIIQYREDNNETWNDGPLRYYDCDSKTALVDGLKPGRIYYFNVLILETLTPENEKGIAKVSKGFTKCFVSNNNTSLNVIHVTNDTITIAWKPIDVRKNECPFLGYILVADEVDGINSLRIDDIKETTYTIQNLTPAQSYYIELRTTTVYGDGYPVGILNVTTLDYDAYLINPSL